ncbi:hypothetical protein AJ78_06860 [Emergomyces pasteurianus Ep9510]|uniref:Uncharacterized protein n=1 Tax=Emergomyces pasteurianus Ep9510 TaxID=1447872 RepID=A0A1J9P921_9EURO|nr:hypothetical protein AJ78_06860 [Emergomyces pasteurianus Ep9510]
MPAFVSRVSSSSIASTKPTILNRREDSVRRKNQRSSSWSAWIPPPLLGQPSDKVSPIRSSSLGRRASPGIAPPSGQKELAERQGSFRRWGKRKDKKSVTFDEDVGVSLEDFESAPGTVRRQKLSGIGPVPGIFPRIAPEERNCVPDPVSRVDFANRSGPVTGNWDKGRTSEGGVHREYWSSLRRQIEENAKFQEERHQRQATKNGTKEQDSRSHQRTVSRDDQLTARGANPRTGVVSPSVMSGGSSSVSRDSQEDNTALQKWRLRGNEWISLEPNEKSPFPSPSGNEIVPPEFPTNNPGPVGVHTSVSPTERAPNLSKPDDKFVVNMPSASEPSPLEMTTQQIVEFQKAIERVHHEGEQMLDPDALPTPRSITPTGISTPPKRLTKNIREKFLGRKRRAKSLSPPLPSKECPKHDCGNGPAIGPNILSCSESRSHRKLCGNEKTDQVPTILSQHDTHGLNREPFLGQSGGQREVCTQISLPQNAPCPHCPAPQWMNAREFTGKNMREFQETALNYTADEEELLGRSQPHYSLTMAQILHDGHTISGLLRTVSKRRTQKESLTENPQRSEILPGHSLHKVIKQENPSTTITTMTPTSIGTSTTSSSPPLEIDQPLLKHGTKPDPTTIPENTSLCRSGRYCSHQLCRRWSEALNKSATTLNCRSEENINHDTGSILLNRSRNMHGSTLISESLSDCSNAHSTKYCGTNTQNQCFNPTMKIHSAQGNLVTTALRPSPMYLNVISPDKGIAFQREGVMKEGLKLGPRAANSPTYRHGQPYMQGRDSQAMKSSGNSGLLNNDNSSTVGGVTPTVQFLNYIVREHHTINFLRLAAVQFLTMILHCLRVTLRLCDCCHKFSKTGDLPRTPRNVNEAGILVIDIGRAFIYFAIMVVVFTFLARGLGFLAMIASWLAWPVKVWRSA